MSEQAEDGSDAFWGDTPPDRESQRYRTLVQAIDDGVIHLDGEGRILAVNDAFLGITGHARDDLLGSHATVVLDEAGYRRVERTVTGEREPEMETSTVEVTLRTRSGDRVRCDLELTLLGDDPREAICLVQETGELAGAGAIGEPSELEREIRKRERRLSELLANVPGMVYRCRNERGWPMEIVSEACEELTGYAPETLVAGDVSWGEEVIVAEDREMVWETVQEETPVDGTFSATYRIETADGERRWVRDYGRGVFDDDGELVEIEGIISDITERKETEQRLAEERDMFADGPAVVFRWVPDEAAGWPVEYVSENVEEVLGYTPAELESGEIAYADLLVPEELDRISREVEEATDGETERFSHEPYRIRTEAGDVRWVKDTTKIVRDEDGEVSNYLGYLVDITERKERERRLEESNERLEQFAHAASHDLQEPLRMVSSYLQLVEERYAADLDEEGREFIEFAVDGADRMREMIDGLLAYSRIQTEGEPFEPVDLERVVADVLEDLQFKIEEYDAEITVGSLPRVDGDGNQLRQVFQNLLDNAIEYSGDERPRVHVSAERVNGQWKITVSDEGIGVDPDQQGRVFEVFERLHTHDEHAGTGIGLALCRRVVERHGGDIWVDSEPGEGSTFSLTLPAVDADTE